MQSRVQPAVSCAAFQLHAFCTFDWVDGNSTEWLVALSLSMCPICNPIITNLASLLSMNITIGKGFAFR